jgi:N-acetylmuramoyl-L-alanine amidase
MARRVAEESRLKQRLVREAVQENLATMRGVRPARAARRARPWGRLALGLLVPAAIALWALPRVAARQPAAPAAAAAALPGAPPPSLEAAPDAATSPGQVVAPIVADLRLAAPVPIDPAVFPLALRKVVLDPGHGGENRGTETPHGLVEKELTLDIAGRLRQLLEADRFSVLMTRGADETVPLDRRAQLANERGGDIFVSIHVNWLTGSSRQGVETYYLGPTDDPFLTALAASENRDSGYSLADFRRLLDGVYADLRQEESRDLARAVQAELLRALRRQSPGLEDRGVKTAPFLVLVATQMPAILAEVSCLSNEEEARRLAEPEYRQQIAAALHAGIRSYAQTLDAAVQKGSS